MRILGVDPGCRFCGFACVELTAAQNIELVSCDVLRLPVRDALYKRMGNLYQFFSSYIIANNINTLALEVPFLGKNALNFLKLGYVRGVLYVLAAKHNLILREYTPRQVKQSLTGYGGASKEQVCATLRSLFCSAQLSSSLDATDALAVAVTAAWYLL
jgi:crossover junction endodeoxyribonuclease RuvC